MSGNAYHQMRVPTTAVPTHAALPARPFAPVLVGQVHALSDRAAQRPPAARLGHSFGAVNVQGGVPRIQPKLQLGSAGDKYEQEADRVADQVIGGLRSTTSETAKPGLHIQRLASGGGTTNPGPGVAAGIQTARGGGRPLPDGMRTQMEQAFGADFSGVRAHDNAHAEQLNQAIRARAFTTGHDMFFKPGAYNPSSVEGQRLLALELTHVVQQNHGQVQRDGMVKRAAPLNPDLIQRQIQTDWGEFKEEYMEVMNETVVTNKADIERWEQESEEPLAMAMQEKNLAEYFRLIETRPQEIIRNDPIGAEILISYDPGEKTDASQIALLQVVRDMKDDTPSFLNKWHKEKQSVQDGPEKGFHLDTHAPHRNPLYAVRKDAEKDTYLSDTKTPEAVVARESGASSELTTVLSDWLHWKDAKYKGLGEHGSRTQKEPSSHKKATLHDIPKRPMIAGDFKLTFETSALAIAGNQAGTYYGSVEWGLARTGSTMALTHLNLKATGDPSANFQKAIERWNQSSALREGKIKQDKTKMYKHPGLDAPVEGTVSQGTQVEISQIEGSSDGAFYQTPWGWIRDEDVEGSGPPVIPLPEPWKGEKAKQQGIRPPKEIEEIAASKTVVHKGEQQEKAVEQEKKKKRKPKTRTAVIFDAPSSTDTTYNS